MYASVENEIKKFKLIIRMWVEIAMGIVISKLLFAIENSVNHKKSQAFKTPSPNEIMLLFWNYIFIVLLSGTKGEIPMYL